MLRAGLEATAKLWPVLAMVYAWVQQAAHLLGEHGARTAAAARQRLGGLLGAMTRHRAAAGTLATAVPHCVRVTRSYGPGRFPCDTVPDLPRTNNDLEQLFGSHRYHERRGSGRKGASPSLVLRGQVRLLAATATRQHAYTATELATADREQRTELRRQWEARRQRRVKRRRFRRDPHAYLQPLEKELLKPVLLS